MALNPYIRVNSKTYVPEQSLIDELTVEAIKIYGHEMYYIPRELVTRDDLFGESKYSRFVSFKMIEMYMDTTTAFEGGDTFTKFGFEIRDSVKFTVSRRRFKRETGKDRPLEGDLLFLPISKGLFEIKFVEHENPFYQLGKLYSFQLTCELFQYSEEEFDTGVPEIDAINEETGFKVNLDLGAVYGGGTFAEGDSVYQYENGSPTGPTAGASARAVVFSYDPYTDPLRVSLSDVVGTWISETSSGATAYIAKANNTVYASIAAKDDTMGILDEAKNEAIQEEADGVFNFDEENPFGDP
jgi:hypothetical protein